MRRIIAFLLLASFTFAQTKPVAVSAKRTMPIAPEADRLPVKRVVLYKSGVGYFEHGAKVRGNQDLTVDFTTAQLDDVLKSLTAVDLGDGKITGVRYNSIAPLDQRLRSLRLPLAEKTNLFDFLSACRGARVEVRSGAVVASGRLLSVEAKQWTKEEEVIEKTIITVVSDSGQFHNVEVTPSTSIHFAERELNQEIGRYLGLVASSREQDIRRMTISSAGSGERDIFVSYISEVPVWKSTYRIIFPTKPGAKPMLQGWAIVDNTVGEDWKDVEISLVAGAPQSFIQKISQPYYLRRPEVGLPQAAMLTPQTHEGTVDAVAEMQVQTLPSNGRGIGSGSGGGTFRVGVPGAVGGVPGGAMGGVLGGALSKSGTNEYRNDGSGYERIAEFNYLASGSSTEYGRNAATTANITAEADGGDLGDLFEYKLKQRVTIGKNQSALVPIISSEIQAEKVTLWNPNAKRALRAVWLNNSSGLTLDAGTFNIVSDGTFAGEGVLDPVKSGEKRLLSYAADQAVRIESDLKSDRQRISKLKLARGFIIASTEVRETKTYRIRNEDADAREVIVEHPARPKFEIKNGVKAEETTANFYRFRVKAEPKKTTEFVVQEASPIENQYGLFSLDSDSISFYIKQAKPDSEMEQMLRTILAKKNAIADLNAQLTARQQETQRLTQDQARIRENMKALKGSAEEKALTVRYSTELNKQEDRLDLLRTEISSLEQKRNDANAELSKFLEGITLEASL